MRRVAAAFARMTREAKDAIQAECVHRLILESAAPVSRNVSLSNLIVQMHARCGSLSEAEATFLGIAKPNRASIAIMIQAYANARQQLDKAKQLLEAAAQQRQEGAAMASARTALLVAYAEQGCIEEAKKIFDAMPRRDVVAWTSMLAAFGENEHVEAGECVFHKMPQRNIISWNAMMAVYEQLDEPGKSKQIFDSMPSANLATWNTLIRSLAKEGHLHDAVDAFEKAPARATETWNTIMAATAECRDMDSVEILFQEIPSRSVVSWTILVTALAQSGHLLRAKKTFDAMPSRNIVSWNSMLQAYVSHDELGAAEEIFLESMPSRSVVSWVTMVMAYATAAGGLEMARRSFDAMAKHSAVAVNAMIHAYARAGQMEEATKMICSNGGFLDFRNPIAFTIAIATCSSVDEARRLFDAQDRRNVVHWNAMLGAYAQAGRGSEAVDFFRDMCQEGFVPDAITFMSLLPACSHAGKVKTSIVELQKMEGDFGISPRGEHWSCIVDAVARSGQLEAAEEMALAMNCAAEGRPVAWSALLAACRMQKDVERACRAGARATVDDASGAPYSLVAASCC